LSSCGGFDNGFKEGKFPTFIEILWKAYLPTFNTSSVNSLSPVNHVGETDEFIRMTRYGPYLRTYDSLANIDIGLTALLETCLNKVSHVAHGASGVLLGAGGSSRVLSRKGAGQAECELLVSSRDEAQSKLVRIPSLELKVLDNIEKYVLYLFMLQL
jgi:hypothetical protein